MASPLDMNTVCGLMGALHVENGQNVATPSTQPATQKTDKTFQETVAALITSATDAGTGNGLLIDIAKICAAYYDDTAELQEKHVTEIAQAMIEVAMDDGEDDCEMDTQFDPFVEDYNSFVLFDCDLLRFIEAVVGAVNVKIEEYTSQGKADERHAAVTLRNWLNEEYLSESKSQPEKFAERVKERMAAHEKLLKICENIRNHVSANPQLKDAPLGEKKLSDLVNDARYLYQAAQYRDILAPILSEADLNAIYLIDCGG